MQVNWNEDKNELLKQTRGVCFEEIEYAMMNDCILDIIPHHNKQKYPNQEIMIISLNDYTYYVPFIMDEEQIFLKNIIPSRTHHKTYKTKES